MTTGTLRNAHETQGTTLNAESPVQLDGTWDQRQLGDWTIVHRRLEPTELDLRLIAGRPTDLESLRAALQDMHGSRQRAVDAEERGYVRLDRVGHPPFMPRPA